MTSFVREYETTVGDARDYLDRADELNGFLFAVAEADDLNAVVGRNDEAEETLWLDQLLGILIMGICNTHDIHPAVLGHMAVDFAMENMDLAE